MHDKDIAIHQGAKKLTVTGSLRSCRSREKKKTFDTFLTELLANNHRFAGLKDSLIRDRVICEIQETNLWRQPLRETELTLQECICTCRASELFGTDRNVGQTLQRVKMTKSEYSRDKSTSQH